eukprot:31765-Amphidinium_carterae.1
MSWQPAESSMEGISGIGACRNMLSHAPLTCHLNQGTNKSHKPPDSDCKPAISAYFSFIFFAAECPSRLRAAGASQDRSSIFYPHKSIVQGLLPNKNLLSSSRRLP